MAIGGGVAGLLVLGGAAFAVVMALPGNNGAASPEAAVEALAEAIDRGDPAAVLAAMPPDEVRLLGDLLTVTQDQATTLGVVDSDEPGAGFEFSLEGLQYDVVQLSADVARVTISEGQLTYDVGGESMAQRGAALVAQSVLDGPATGIIDVNDPWRWTINGRRTQPFVIAVKKDDGWYVSPLYTTGQIVTDLNDEAPPIFGLANPTTVAQSDPEGAVRVFLEATARFDATGLAGVMPSGEASAVAAYGSLFTGLPSRLANGRYAGRNLQIDKLTTTTQEADDGVVLVTVQSLETTWSAGDDFTFMGVDGSCYYYNQTTSCLEDRIGGTGARLTFACVQVDGGWRVSAIGSLAQTLNTVVSSIEERPFLAAVGLGRLLPPTATLEVGTRQPVTLDKSGYATATFDAPAGPLYVLASGDGGDVEGLYDSSGGSHYGPDGLPVAGEYTALVSGPPDSTVQVVASSPPEPVPLTVGSSVTGKIGGGLAVFLVDIEIPPDGAQISVSGAPGLLLTWTNASEYCGSNDSDEFVCTIPDPGATTIIVEAATLDIESEITVQADVAPGPTVDGLESTTTLVVDGDYNPHTISLPANTTAEIVAVPFDIGDLVLTIQSIEDGSSITVDSRGSGAAEAYTLTNPYSSPKSTQIWVQEYNGRDMEYGVKITETGD